MSTSNVSVTEARDCFDITGQDVKPDLLDQEVAEFQEKSTMTRFAKLLEENRGMLSSFNQHLKEHNYGYYLIRSEEFAQLKMVTADCLTEDEVDRLYSSGQLGSHTPEALLHTVWFNNTIYFGMRGVQEHYDMKWGDLKLKQDGNGDDYVAFCGRSRKTRGGAVLNNIRQDEPRMWATKENPERCPVRMFKRYSELRPSHCMKETEPFYISTCTDMKWFRGEPVGINKLGSFKKSMGKAAGLTDGGPQAKRPRSTQGPATTIPDPVRPIPDPVSTIPDPWGHIQYHS